MQRNANGRGGFSLIELLVVIGIIAILAAILFPMLTKARARAIQTQCLSNMGQLYKGFRMYIDENNGRMPLVRIHENTGMPEKNWVGSRGFGAGNGMPQIQKGQLWPYTKSLGMYQCKADINLPARDFGGIRNFPFSYSVNNTLCGNYVESFPTGMARKGVMMLHELRSTINDGDFNIGVDQISKVHYDGTTVLYLDGRAAWKTTVVLEKERTTGLWTFPAPWSLPINVFQSIVIRI